MPPAPIPPPPLPWPMPQLHLRIDDLDHLGADVFLEAVKPKDALRDAVLATFRWLYTPETVPRTVQHILLVLRVFDGVAVTFGTAAEKEIHFSLGYIKATRARARAEIMGVLVHEVVHCFQHDARGTCPGGLVEGIADYVRLHAGLAPPHWRRFPGERWDQGYERTAYFLAWIEGRYGDGTVRELNLWMRDRAWHRRVFKELTGRPVRKLWKLYCASLEEEEEEERRREGFVVVDAGEADAQVGVYVDDVNSADSVATQIPQALEYVCVY